MATNKVGGGDAPDARERQIRTAPELTDEFETKETEPTPPVAEDKPIDESAAPDEPVETKPHAAVIPPQMLKQSFFKRCRGWLGSHKKVSIPLALLLVLGVLAAIPFTRYAIAGLVLKQQFTVTVVDSETKQPVTSAKVRIDGVEATTDNKGKASARVPVGKANIEVSKKYFKSAEQTVIVPILKQKDVPELRLQATGRQVSVKVTNKISKKALGNVLITAADTEAKTDADGTATLVVPAGEEKVEATLKASGFNDSNVTVEVMKGESENSFTLTPAGKIYFLSNQSGKLDVVKTNLDGTDRQVVLAGTGKEMNNQVSMLLSKDQRYIAFQSRRDSDKPKVYLIDTQNGNKLSVIDEGNASFNLVGWSDHLLVYTVNREVLKQAEPKQYALKTFNADTKKLTTLDETGGDSFNNYEVYNRTELIGNQILLIKQWYNYGYSPYNKHSINLMNADGTNRRTLKEYDAMSDGMTYLDTRRVGVDDVYISYRKVHGQPTYTFAVFSDGKVKDLPSFTIEEYQSLSPQTYMKSPSGEFTLWEEMRDGVPVIFIGNKEGKSEQKIAALPKFGIYGWYGDDYILLTKEGTQLYIAPRGPVSETDLTKVTDFYPAGRHY